MAVLSDLPKWTGMSLKGPEWLEMILNVFQVQLHRQKDFGKQFCMTLYAAALQAAPTSIQTEDKPIVGGGQEN